MDSFQNFIAFSGHSPNGTLIRQAQQCAEIISDAMQSADNFEQKILICDSDISKFTYVRFPKHIPENSISNLRQKYQIDLTLMVATRTGLKIAPKVSDAVQLVTEDGCKFQWEDKKNRIAIYNLAAHDKELVINGRAVLKSHLEMYADKPVSTKHMPSASIFNNIRKANYKLEFPSYFVSGQTASKSWSLVNKMIEKSVREHYSQGRFTELLLAELRDSIKPRSCEAAIKFADRFSNLSKKIEHVRELPINNTAPLFYCYLSLNHIQCKLGSKDSQVTDRERLGVTDKTIVVCIQVEHPYDQRKGFAVDFETRVKAALIKRSIYPVTSMRDHYEMKFNKFVFTVLSIVNTDEMLHSKVDKIILPDTLFM